MATIVTDQNFTDEVLSSKVPVLVDFFAEWCGPCKMIAPVVEELAHEYEGKAKVVKLNVDESMDTAQKYGVMSIPTLIFFKNGEEVDRSVGLMSKDAMGETLDRLAA
ncbi:MAG: thioredoxin [Candidatus Gracilibacteria bacterium]